MHAKNFMLIAPQDTLLRVVERSRDKGVREEQSMGLFPSLSTALTQATWPTSPTRLQTCPTQHAANICLKIHGFLQQLHLFSERKLINHKPKSLLKAFKCLPDFSPWSPSESKMQELYHFQPRLKGKTTHIDERVRPLPYTLRRKACLFCQMLHTQDIHEYSFQSDVY